VRVKSRTWFINLPAVLPPPLLSQLLSSHLSRTASTCHVSKQSHRDDINSSMMRCSQTSCVNDFNHDEANHNTWLLCATSHQRERQAADLRSHIRVGPEAKSALCGAVVSAASGRDLAREARSARPPSPRFFCFENTTPRKAERNTDQTTFMDRLSSEWYRRDSSSCASLQGTSRGIE
jgi:hypothetical protein